MVSKKLAVGGAIAACAVCCAPLVVPLVWPALLSAGVAGAGAAGGGWLAGLTLDLVISGGLVLAAFAAGATWLRQSRRRSATRRPVLRDGAGCDLQACGPAAGTPAKATGKA